MKNDLKIHLIRNYESAEITSIFLHHRKDDVAYNLLTLIELVPAEQETSRLIADEKAAHLDRSNKGLSGMTVYIGRSVGIPVGDALEIYLNFQQGFELTQGSALKRNILPFPANALSSEPPGYCSLTLASAERNNLSQVFPMRNTDLRLWMLLDNDKAWVGDYDEWVFDAILSNTAELSRKYLDTDLAKFDEHLGNVYLFAANPLLRDDGFSLIDHEKSCWFNLKKGMVNPSQAPN